MNFVYQLVCVWADKIERSGSIFAKAVERENVKEEKYNNTVLCGWSTSEE